MVTVRAMIAMAAVVAMATMSTVGSTATVSRLRNVAHREQGNRQRRKTDAQNTLHPTLQRCQLTATMFNGGTGHRG